MPSGSAPKLDSRAVDAKGNTAQEIMRQYQLMAV
jgi:hypothetical protein